MTTLGGHNSKTPTAALYRQFKRRHGARISFASTVLRAALSKPGGTFCNGFSSCTAAVATSQSTNVLNTDVSAVWTAINSATVGSSVGR